MPSLMQRAAAKGKPEDEPIKNAPANEGPEAPAAEAAEGEQPGGEGAKFNKPDITQFIPNDMRDIVDRVVAAGHKVIYSEQMRQQVLDEIGLDTPVPQKLAEAVVGLLLTLDSKSQGGIPQAALFPAAVGLLGEAAEILSAAGQVVTQEDFNEALRMMFVLIAKKLGASDDDVMAMSQQALRGQAAPGAPAAPPGPPAAPAGVAGAPAGVPPGDDEWED